MVRTTSDDGTLQSASSTGLVLEQVRACRLPLFDALTSVTEVPANELQPVVMSTRNLTEIFPDDCMMYCDKCNVKTQCGKI